MSEAKVFIAAIEGHPENIELVTAPWEGDPEGAVVATCPRCGSFANEYADDGESVAQLARQAIRNLQTWPCSPRWEHVGHLAGPLR